MRSFISPRLSLKKIIFTKGRLEKKKSEKTNESFVFPFVHPAPGSVAELLRGPTSVPGLDWSPDLMLEV